MGENSSWSRGAAHKPGGLYGGGGGGPGDGADMGQALNPGARGCVRIIWGPNRSFPSTGTGDM
jgi:hypothetical protein